MSRSSDSVKPAGLLSNLEQPVLPVGFVGFNADILGKEGVLWELLDKPTQDAFLLMVQKKFLGRPERELLDFFKVATAEKLDAMFKI